MRKYHQTMVFFTQPLKTSCCRPKTTLCCSCCDGCAVAKLPSLDHTAAEGGEGPSAGAAAGVAKTTTTQTKLDAGIVDFVAACQRGAGGERQGTTLGAEGESVAHQLTGDWKAPNVPKRNTHRDWEEANNSRRVFVIVTTQFRQ